MSKPPRILYMSVFHPELVRGGAQQAAYELFLGARAAGLDATFVASVEPNVAPSLFKPGAIFTGFDNRPNEYLFLSDSYEHEWYRNVNIRALKWFAEFLRDLQPEVVHFHHFMTMGLDLFLVARQVLPKAKLVLTLHEFLGICKADGHMVRKNEKALCLKASSVRCHQCFPSHTPEIFQLREDWVKHCYGVFDAFITPTDFVKRRYVDWGLPAEKVHTVTNAQADYSRTDYRVKIPAAESARAANRFGFFGQLVDDKGLAVVFDALEHYARTYEEPLQLDINGANLQFASERFQARFKEFLGAAKALEPLVRVEFLGSYSMPDLPSRMGRVDWVLVPSTWWEIFGLVVSEAFMFRRPPICSNIGGMAERISHDQNGLLFEAGDPVRLAETMHRCITEDGLHARLARNSPGVPPVSEVVRGHCDVYGLAPSTPRPAKMKAALRA